MKIKTIFVMFTVFMLSGCFFSEDPLSEEQAKKVKQSDIRTANVAGHIKCSKDGETYFDYDVLSFSRWGSSGVEFINKEGILYADSINNCTFISVKGKADSYTVNKNLYNTNN